MRHQAIDELFRRCIMLVSILAIGFSVPACVKRDPLRDRSEGDTVSFQSDNTLNNLLLAKRYPWLDQGACVAQNAHQKWSELARACFSQLDRTRLRFQDTYHACPVAQIAANPEELRTAIALCLFMQPEIILGAVIVVGVLTVAPLIVEAIEARRSCWCMCASPGRLDGGKKVANLGACGEYCAANHPGAKAVCK